MKRAIVTIVLATILIIIVLGVTAVLAFTSGGPKESYTQQTAWLYAFPQALMAKIIDVNGDGQDDLVIQNDTNVRVLNGQGDVLLNETFSTGFTVTLGDMNGDTIEDIIAAESGSTGSSLVVLFSDGTRPWGASLSALQAPSRAAMIRFDDGDQVVVGDEQGHIMGIDRLTGEEVWRGSVSGENYIRGLDEALVNGYTYVVAANRNGAVKLFTADGREQWRYDLGEEVRRLRIFDLDGDGNSEVYIGGNTSKLVILESALGEERFSTSVGQPVTQIRELELDGDPSAREFVVGGKDGGVWAYTMQGEQLWARSVSDKVNDIGTIDTNNDGIDEILVGDDAGRLVLFAGVEGVRYTLTSYSSGIMRITTGNLADNASVAIANVSDVQALSIEYEKTTIPIWYNPLLAGVVISASIIVIAWFVAHIPEKPPEPVLELTAMDQSVEGLKAHRVMLYENIADVQRMRKFGEMPVSAYDARLKELRKQMAKTEAELLKAGVNLEAQTVKCPNCGAQIKLGDDTCDYCGHIVLR